MSSTIAKIWAEKQQERKTFMRDIIVENDPRYFIITKDGKMVASGTLEEVKEQLGTEYSLSPILYWRYDRFTEIVKIIM